MKTKFFLFILALALSYTASAQFPNFIKVDSGALAVTPGGHRSSSSFDMDNDGDLDLLVSNVGGSASFDFSVYKNERNGFFVKTPKFVSLQDTRNLHSIGDIDNDGDLDLFAGIYGYQGISRLYLNDGYGNFHYDTTISLGNSSIYPSLIDFNGDGFLDMLLIDRYGKVFYNNGEGGFQESSLGLLHDPSNIGMQGTSWGDVDDDGDMDIYGGYTYDGSVDHVSKNACFLNNGDGTFVKFDETSVIFDDSASANPSLNWVDYDNDGDMDLYVVNMTLDSINGPLDALYENLGEMQFTKHVFEDPMYRNSFTISSVWGDLDNDADLDLYVTVENNPFPWGGDISATPYNILFVNDGNGGFTNILDHPLAYEDSHTVIMFDHDNDGDLDIFLTRYSWSNDGYTNIFQNEGNDNSWMVLTCEGTISNRSAIGSRVQAKAFVNGKHIIQTREITPINGHLTYANLRVHFGFGDTDIIDTLIIRWPSGLVDEYTDVQTNKFYKAIENTELVIDYSATNYIKYSPHISDIYLDSTEQSVSIDLNEHFHFIKGDTVPVIDDDTLYYSIYSNENPEEVLATVEGSILTLEALTDYGFTVIHLIASAGSFTSRMESFTVFLGPGSVPSNYTSVHLSIYPNPSSGEIHLRYSISDPSTSLGTGSRYSIFEVYSIQGVKLRTLMEHVQQPGEYELTFDISDLPAGMYFVRMQVGRQVETVKIVKLGGWR